MTAPTATVVLGGGAPNGALTAGALCAIYEKKKTFNRFYTSGAGAVFGLLTIAPAKATAVEALAATQRAGVHEAIYSIVPVGYKTFVKSGPFGAPMRKLADKLKLKETDDVQESSFPELYNDWIDLWAAALTPTFVNPRSEALCAPVPFPKDVIDFKRVSSFNGRFYMNAYCIETGRMEQFTKEQITADHVNAALAFPFVNPPAAVGGKHYYEGSAVDPLNLSQLGKRIEDDGIPRDGHTVVLIDTLGELGKSLVRRRAQHLRDAYSMSTFTPIVSLAQAKRELFALEGKLDLLPLTFDVPPSLYPTMTDWSRSNLNDLFDVGRIAGEKFWKQHRDKLPDRVEESADPAR